VAPPSSEPKIGVQFSAGFPKYRLAKVVARTDRDLSRCRQTPKRIEGGLLGEPASSR
jgi:hypothetical protein